MNNCPFLGLKEDPQTAARFPSDRNFCYRTQKPGAISFKLQQKYCLVKGYSGCPVFQDASYASLPIDKRLKSQRQPERSFSWIVWVVLACVILVAILAVGRLSPPGWFALVMPAPTAALEILPEPTETALPVVMQSQPSSTVLPTLLPSPTPTGFPSQTHALEVPILVGEQSILMHRVVAGEQIILLAKHNQTTIDVLQAINQLPPVPLYTGQVIVIAPDLSVVDPNLPAFEPYQVTDQEISIEALAGRLGVEQTMLKYYNRCSDACRLVKGDWLLIPPATNTPLPVTPTQEASPTPSTFPPRAHTLEVPFMIGKQQILMHRIQEWEQALLLIKQYKTTIEALQDINYYPAVPLLAGQVIAIAPGLIINVDPVLPFFEAYQVSDKEISIEALATKLGVDQTKLKYYNQCSDACPLVKGDWLLIPRAK